MMFNNSISFTYFDVLILILVFVLYTVLFNSRTVVRYARNNTIAFAVSLLVLGVVILFLSVQLLYGAQIISWSPFTALWGISSSTSVCTWMISVISPRYGYLYTVQYLLTTMLLIIIVAIYYTVAFDMHRLLLFIVYSISVFIGGVILVIATRPLPLFISYEMLLLPTAYIIDTCSKTARSRDAAKSMCIWTQSGAFILFSAVGILIGDHTQFLVGGHSQAGLSAAGATLLVIATTFGFGTKMPIYPFYWWLPEAHVEVSTNFSIVLSGVTIKFAFLGYVRFIDWIGFGDIHWLLFVLIAVGFFDALLRVDCECDIKKLVAYQTVIEMHVSAAFVLLDPTVYVEALMFMLNTHCWISATQFIIVDIITKRYHTRNIEHLYGIFAASPNSIKMIFITVFILGSVPGTSLFAIEFIMQIYITGQPFGFLMFVGTTFTTVVWSRNIWWSLWGGDVLRSSFHIPFNLTKNEWYFMLICIIHILPPVIFMDLGV